MKKNTDIKIAFLDFRNEFIEIALDKLNEVNAPFVESEKYDIIAIGESGCVLKEKNIYAKYVLCPHITPCRGSILCKHIISCGMSGKSTFSISSTMQNNSLFSVNRTIALGNEHILPFEEYFQIDTRLSLYENIILHGIEKIIHYEKRKSFV